MRCPRCSFEHDFRTCPNCGLPSPQPPQPPPPVAPGGGSGSGFPSDGRPGLPWERRAETGAGALSAMFETIKLVLFDPVRAFREMRITGGIGDPFLYGWVLLVIGSFCGVFWQLAAQSMGIGGTPFAMAGEDTAAAFSGMICGLIIGVPIGAAIGLFVASGITHLALMLLGGARNGYEATFRAYAFSAGSAAPFQIIPVCGGLIGGVWTLVAFTIGLKQAHETDTWRAVVAVLLPFALCCACLIALFMTVGAAALAGLQQAAGG